MSPHPGEVWLADLGLAAKTRPVVIVSRHDPDAPRALILYVPLTTQNRFSAYEVAVPKLRFLDRESVANVQGLGSLPSVRLERRIGELPQDVMANIKRRTGLRSRSEELISLGNPGPRSRRHAGRTMPD
jgi:mRNA interferase MazF